MYLGVYVYRKKEPIFKQEYVLSEKKKEKKSERERGQSAVYIQFYQDDRSAGRDHPLGQLKSIPETVPLVPILHATVAITPSEPGRQTIRMRHTAKTHTHPHTHTNTNIYIRIYI